MGERREAGQRGKLYLCATPIGNMEDITLRVLRVLREADLIAAEDTRRTRKLLAHYGIHKPLTSYREENREAKGRELMEFMASGRDVALVTDAGMPGISDPGVHLVRLAAERQVQVIPVPGACAVVTALAVSGLPATGFVFGGFLPRRSRPRRKVLEALQGETRTLVFYEAPHRLVEALEDMRDVLGEREAAVGRELTKLNEEVVRGTLGDLVARFRAAPPRGELTVVVRGTKETEGERGEPAVVRRAHQGRDGHRRDGRAATESGRRNCGRNDCGGRRDSGGDSGLHD